MAKVINQIKYNNVEYAIAHSAYATCGTASATAAKVAAVVTDSITGDDFTLIKGVTVNVWFQNTNTADNATIAVGGSAAKPIYYKNAAIPKNFLQANRTYTLAYDGTNWVVVGDITAVTNSSPTLAWDTKSTIGTVDGTALEVTMPANPNTDTKVTAVGNHYSPSTNSSYDLSVDASSSTAATWNSTSLVTGVNITRDACGHVTGLTVDSIKMPSNPNTDTDTKVTQTSLGSTSTTDYYLLASSASSPTSGYAYGANYTSSIKLRGTGQLTATTFYANSDKRLKENIVEYVPKHSILELPVYKYNFIADETKTTNIGCLAQDLQEICPEIVDTDNKGYLSINESKIVYLLLDELKKVKAEMTRLNTELEELKNKSN